MAFYLVTEACCLIHLLAFLGEELEMRGERVDSLDHRDRGGHLAPPRRVEFLEGDVAD